MVIDNKISVYNESCIHAKKQMFVIEIKLHHHLIIYLSDLKLIRSELVLTTRVRAYLALCYLWAFARGKLLLESWGKTFLPD